MFKRYYHGLSGSIGGYRGLLGAIKGYRGLLGTIRDSQGQSEISKISGAIEGYRGLLGTIRDSQGQSEISKIIFFLIFGPLLDKICSIVPVLGFLKKMGEEERRRKKKKKSRNQKPPMLLGYRRLKNQKQFFESTDSLRRKSFRK